MNIDYPNGMKAAELYICDGDIKEYNTNFYCINFFVKNQKGYRNLCKLTSIAMTKGYIIKPRINHNILEQYKDGLICLSGAKGEVAKKLSALRHLLRRKQGQCLVLQEVFFLAKSRLPLPQNASFHCNQLFQQVLL